MPFDWRCGVALRLLLIRKERHTLAILRRELAQACGVSRCFRRCCGRSCRCNRSILNEYAPKRHELEGFGAACCRPGGEELREAAAQRVAVLPGRAENPTNGNG